jgi:hypothetical protein
MSGAPHFALHFLATHFNSIGAPHLDLRFLAGSRVRLDHQGVFRRVFMILGSVISMIFVGLCFLTGPFLPTLRMSSSSHARDESVTGKSWRIGYHQVYFVRRPAAAVSGITAPELPFTPGRKEEYGRKEPHRPGITVSGKIIPSFGAPYLGRNFASAPVIQFLAGWILAGCLPFTRVFCLFPGFLRKKGGIRSLSVFTRVFRLFPGFLRKKGGIRSLSVFTRVFRLFPGFLRKKGGISCLTVYQGFPPLSWFPKEERRNKLSYRLPGFSASSLVS